MFHERVSHLFQRVLPSKVPAAVSVGAEGPSKALSGKRILIIDDDAVILRTVALKLKGEGYAPVTAVDASEAIGAVRDKRPDLILLDISFPPDISNGGRVTWDGFQIMAWLRGLQEASGVPFIIITGGDPTVYRELSFKRGAVAFFHKPIDHEELLVCIKRVIG